MLSDEGVDSDVRAEVLALLESHDSIGNFLEPTSIELSAGQCLGRYRILERIGGGGMGDVYRASDEQLGRDVAIKVVRYELSDESRESFAREARAIAALSHVNILSVHDVGVEDGRPFLVTELLEGETLRSRLTRQRPSVAQALEWIIQIANGLAAAHDKRILHRDLKPENLFVTPQGTIKILDFGLAQRTELEPLSEPDEGEPAAEPATIVGTAAYLSPELIGGERASSSSDLFSLGAIAFEMLTGRRAFAGTGMSETLSNVVGHELPPVSSMRKEVPQWLDQLVERAVAKERTRRWQSARDLAYAVRSGQALVSADPTVRNRWRRPLIAVSLLAILTTSAMVASWRKNVIVKSEPALASSPSRIRALTNSGRDMSPAVSPNGRFMAFVSDRDSQSRIWLRLLESGRERALTEGPDLSPRFSPDGTQVLFRRARGTSSMLYRIDLLGGPLHKVAENAGDADWSPDGSEVVFARWVNRGKQARPVLTIAKVDGSSERKLAELGNRIELRPRWSPDGKWIALTGVVQQPGAKQKITLIATTGSERRVLSTPNRVGLVSAVSWDGPRAIVYSQAVSVLGNAAGSAAQVVRQQIDDGAFSTLLWTRESSTVLEQWPGRGLIFDARSAVQNLREVPLSGRGSAYVSHGTATDRQPIYSPDGERIVFSSSRGGDLDLWVVERATGEARALTDDDGDDWDPAFSADGSRIFWSSDRTGDFEIWSADADGSNARQLTSGGLDAENPTPTADGEWVVFSLGVPSKKGIWKMRMDGTEMTRLVADVILPAVSPDGRHVLFQTNRSPLVAAIGVARVSDGVVLPFDITIEVHKPSRAILGRGRWTPDGRSIAFVGQDENGNNGVYLQTFSIDTDTTNSRRAIGGFDPDRVTESFDINERTLVLAEWEQRFGILSVTEGRFDLL